MSDRKLFGKREIVILTVLLLLCGAAGLLLWLLPKGTAAVVERNGEVVLRQELSTLRGPVTYEVQGENGITLQMELSPTGAAVLSSECPDKICVHTGVLHRAGEAAVCLPARVVLRLEGAGAVDGIS